MTGRNDQRERQGDRFRPILDQFAKVFTWMRGQPKFGWGTVVQASPLAVQLDASIDAAGAQVPGPAQSAVGALTVGMRVYCIEQHRRVVVISAPN